jgi:Rieske Fe-S protein
MKPDQTLSKLTRRAFLLRLALWSGWSSLSLSLIQWLKVPSYKLPVRQVALGQPEAFPIGLTPLPLYQAWLVRTATGFYALKSVCPHLGCPPEWQPASQAFVCPCHGSRFALSGSLQHGPSLRALERYEIFRDPSGQLILNLDQTLLRENGEWNLPQAFVSWHASRS